MGQFLPADHTRGDANTVGGYAAVHSRPPAFEGSDGIAYSVEIVTDATGEKAQPYAAYLLFVKWSTGDPFAAGHLETEYLHFGGTEEEARAKAAAMHLSDARAELDRLITARTTSGRAWWEVMRDEDAG